MNGAVIAQFLTSVGVASIIVAAINWIAQRKRVGADTAVVLSGEARAWANQAMERVTAAEARVDGANTRADSAEAAAQQCRARVRQLEDYIEQLYDIMKQAGLEPPSVPPTL